MNTSMRSGKNFISLNQACQEQSQCAVKCCFGPTVDAMQNMAIVRTVNFCLSASTPNANVLVSSFGIQKRFFVEISYVRTTKLENNV